MFAKQLVKFQEACLEWGGKKKEILRTFFPLCQVLIYKTIFLGMSKLTNFYETWASFGPGVQDRLHEKRKLQWISKGGVLFGALRRRNYFQKTGLFFWSLGLFLDLQGNRSNRLHVFLAPWQQKVVTLLGENGACQER